MRIEWYERLLADGIVSEAEYAELYRLAARERRKHSTYSARPFSTYLVRGPGWIRTAGNLWTTVGATYLLGNALVGGPAIYLGLIAGATSPVFVIGDTMASHAGWSEVASSDIVQTVRQTLNWGAISGGVVNNSASQVSYQMAPGLVGTRTLQGGFIADNNTLGGSTGNLIAEAAFDQGAASVSAGNVVTILVTVTVLAG